MVSRLRDAAAGAVTASLLTGLLFTAGPLRAADPGPIVLQPGERVTVVAATPAPTSTPTSTPIPASPTPTAPSATPTPRPTATVAPTPTPTSTPTPPPSGATILSVTGLPTSGSAWTNVLAWAAKTPDIDLTDLNADGDVVTLAKALVAARTGDSGRRAEVVDALVRVQSSGVYRALELARGVPGYVLAADLIGYRDPAFVAWAKAQRTRSVTGGPSSIVACQEQRPNNWGTWCSAARTAIDRYVGDAPDLARAVTVFRGWLGDRSAYASFSYGDLSWQSDPSHPVGINPKGATIAGHDVDGVLPDDQRRSGSFSWPPPNGNYVWEALQGATLTGVLVPDAWGWSDNALERAVRWQYEVNDYPPAGDDTCTPWTVNHFAGTSFAAATPCQPGKGFGFTDWLFG